MALTPIPIRRLYQEVADQITGLTRAGNYRPGDRLPPERDLSRQLGVSRPVVREAMVALEIIGVVEIRGGSGVYIREMADHAGMPDVGGDPYEIFIARRVLEAEIAAAAAKNWNADTLAEIRTALAQMQREIPELPIPAHAQIDRRFHLAIAAASGSTVYCEILRYVWDELQLKHGLIWERLRNRRAVRRTRLEEHETIVRAIAARDAAGARKAVRAHFAGAIRDFLEIREHGRTLASGAGRAVQGYSTAAETTDFTIR